MEDTPGGRKGRRTARQLEARAATLPALPSTPAPESEVVAMLVRRGFHPRPAPLLLPFPADIGGPAAEALCEKLGHYAFRLFLRGAILLGPRPFLPEEATRYLSPPQARTHAEALVSLGLGAREEGGRYRLLHPVPSFGGTLEWYVARELARRWGLTVAVGLNFHAPGVGGDLDVVATAEGRLFYLELKSGPPKHLSQGEVGSFLERTRALRPHVALFVLDTSLRLSDKVLPLFEKALGGAWAPQRLLREVWALTPHLYVTNARQDLLLNVGHALAAGLRALGPGYP